MYEIAIRHRSGDTGIQKPFLLSSVLFFFCFFLKKISIFFNFESLTSFFSLFQKILRSFSTCFNNPEFLKSGNQNLALLLCAQSPRIVKISNFKEFNSSILSAKITR